MYQIVSVEKELGTIPELKDYLKKNAKPEIKPVFDLLERHKMAEVYRIQAYKLLKTINDRWPPETEEIKWKMARQLEMLKEKIPEMERLHYETSLRGILTDTWKLTTKQITEGAKQITQTVFNIGKWIPIVVVAVAVGLIMMNIRRIKKAIAG